MADKKVLLGVGIGNYLVNYFPFTDIPASENDHFEPGLPYLIENYVKPLKLNGLELRIKRVADLEKASTDVPARLSRASPDTQQVTYIHFTHTLINALASEKVSPEVYDPFQKFIVHADAYEALRKVVPREVIKKTVIENVTDHSNYLPTTVNLAYKYHTSICIDTSHLLLSFEQKKDNLSKYLADIRAERISTKPYSDLTAKLTLNEKLLDRIGKKVRHAHISGIKTENGKQIHHVPLGADALEFNDINAIKLAVIRGIFKRAKKLDSITVELGKEYLNLRAINRTLVYAKKLIFNESNIL